MGGRRQTDRVKGNIYGGKKNHKGDRDEAGLKGKDTERSNNQAMEREHLGFRQGEELYRQDKGKEIERSYARKLYGESNDRDAG